MVSTFYPPDFRHVTPQRQWHRTSYPGRSPNECPLKQVSFEHLHLLFTCHRCCYLSSSSVAPTVILHQSRLILEIKSRTSPEGCMAGIIWRRMTFLGFIWAHKWVYALPTGPCVGVFYQPGAFHGYGDTSARLNRNCRFCSDPSVPDFTQRPPVVTWKKLE
jgi:hypothetical protein